MKSKKDIGLILRFSEKDIEDPVRVLRQLLDVMFSREDEAVRHCIRVDMMLQTIAVMSAEAQWKPTCNAILWEILAPSLRSILLSTTPHQITAHGDRSRAAFEKGLCAGYVLLTYLRLLRHDPPHITTSIRRSAFFAGEVFNKGKKQVQDIWYDYRKVAPLWAAIIMHLGNIHAPGAENLGSMAIDVWPIEFLSAPQESLEFLHEFFTSFLLMGCSADRQRTYSEKGANAKAKKVFSCQNDFVRLELDWVDLSDIAITTDLPKFSTEELVILRQYRAK